MRYKFIGTKKDLIDNGFEQRLANFIRGNVGYCGAYIRVDCNNDLSIVFPICEPNYNFYDGVGGTKKYIQDLIDNGLVEEVV